MEDSPESRLHEARHRYSTAFLLYYSMGYKSSARSLALSYQPAICLLDSALNLVPDFSDASDLREELWHKFLIQSKNKNEGQERYHLYLQSDAWQQKRQERLTLDGGICACGLTASHVHHKTYGNIGKEQMTDLVSMCEDCHNHVHQKSPRAAFVLPAVLNEGETLIDDNPSTRIQREQVYRSENTVPFGG